MAAEWYYRNGNREVGPLVLRDLTSIARQGRLDSNTEVRCGRSGAWMNADRVPGLLLGPSRSTPPPLPSAADSLFAAIDKAGSAATRRKTNFAGRTSLSVGLLCLGGVGAVAVLFTVALLAVGTAGNSQGPAGGSRDAIAAPATPTETTAPPPLAAQRLTAAPMDGDSAKSVSIKSTAPRQDPPPVATAPRAAATPAGGNWMERIDEKSHDSVVVVVNTEGNSSGTGFVIAADGDRKLLLTNKHVMRIGDDPKTDPLARECLLKTVAGKVMHARLAAEARDPAVDLALLVVDARELRPLGAIKKFADIHVGENVVTVGNPGLHGTDIILEGTMTPGIVSSKRAEMLIQTTAPDQPRQ